MSDSLIRFGKLPMEWEANAFDGDVGAERATMSHAGKTGRRLGANGPSVAISALRPTRVEGGSGIEILMGSPSTPPFFISTPLATWKAACIRPPAPPPALFELPVMDALMDMSGNVGSGGSIKVMVGI